MDSANDDALRTAYRRLAKCSPAAAADHVAGLGDTEKKALAAAAAVLATDAKTANDKAKPPQLDTVAKRLATKPDERGW